MCNDVGPCHIRTLFPEEVPDDATSSVSAELAEARAD